MATSSIERLYRINLGEVRSIHMVVSVRAERVVQVFLDSLQFLESLAVSDEGFMLLENGLVTDESEQLNRLVEVKVNGRRIVADKELIGAHVCHDWRQSVLVLCAGNTLVLL